MKLAYPIFGKVSFVDYFYSGEFNGILKQQSKFHYRNMATTWSLLKVKI
jgi:hypothetical protein